MWLNDKRTFLLKEALKKRNTSELDQALEDILNQNTSNAIPSVCPQCQHDLIPQTLPSLEITVSACPHHHGLWISAEAQQSLQNFILGTTSFTHKKRIARRIAIFSLFSTLILAVAIQNPNMILRPYQDFQNTLEAKKINEHYWPMPNFTGWYSLPIKESVIDHQDELIYFQKLTILLEHGIGNRYNVTKVLQAKLKRNFYLNTFSIFKEKQQEVVRRLYQLTPPERLNQFHEALLEAAKEQIVFYQEFTDEKYQNSSIQLDQLLANPHLKRCNELLWSAYYEFQRLYPDRDQATNDAVEQRLCQFDVI